MQGASRGQQSDKRPTWGFSDVLSVPAPAVPGRRRSANADVTALQEESTAPSSQDAREKRLSITGENALRKFKEFKNMVSAKFRPRAPSEVGVASSVTNADETCGPAVSYETLSRDVKGYMRTNLLDQNIRSIMEEVEKSAIVSQIHGQSCTFFLSVVDPNEIADVLDLYRDTVIVETSLSSKRHLALADTQVRDKLEEELDQTKSLLQQKEEEFDMTRIEVERTRAELEQEVGVSTILRTQNTNLKAELDNKTTDLQGKLRELKSMTSRCQAVTNDLLETRQTSERERDWLHKVKTAVDGASSDFREKFETLFQRKNKELMEDVLALCPKELISCDSVLKVVESFRQVNVQGRTIKNHYSDFLSQLISFKLPSRRPEGVNTQGDLKAEHLIEIHDGECTLVRVSAGEAPQDDHSITTPPCHRIADKKLTSTAACDELKSPRSRKARGNLLLSNDDDKSDEKRSSPRSRRRLQTENLDLEKAAQAQAEAIEGEHKERGLGDEEQPSPLEAPRRGERRCHTHDIQTLTTTCAAVAADNDDEGNGSLSPRPSPRRRRKERTRTREAAAPKAKGEDDPTHDSDAGEDDTGKTSSPPSRDRGHTKERRCKKAQNNDSSHAKTARAVADASRDNILPQVPQVLLDGDDACEREAGTMSMDTGMARLRQAQAPLRASQKDREAKREFAMEELRTAAKNAAQYILQLKEEGDWHHMMMKLRELRATQVSKNHPLYSTIEAHFDEPEIQAQLQSLFAAFSENGHLLTTDNLSSIFTNLHVKMTALKDGEEYACPLPEEAYLSLTGVIEQSVTHPTFVIIFGLFWLVYAQASIIKGRGDGSTQAEEGETVAEYMTEYHVEIRGRVVCRGIIISGKFQRGGDIRIGRYNKVEER